MKADISTVLTTLLIVAHIAVSVADFFDLYPIADFMIRPDGTQMQPNQMLPFEKVLVGMIGFPFLIILLAFILLTSRKDAAALSFGIHTLFAWHQIWNKSAWDAIFHPDSAITLDFLILTHVGWAVVSAIIWLLNASGGAAGDEQKDKSS